MQGTIKKKMDDKGFGFISSSELEKEGDNVTFDTEESPKGLNAINVTIAA
jgi:cold shock CspA family protein